MATNIALEPEAVASVAQLYDAMQTKAKPLVDRFEERYNAWKQTWDSPTERSSEFTVLIGMGVKVLPLIVHKLCSETHSLVIDLYNAVEKNTSFQSQSRSDIIAKNKQRNQTFTEYAALWETYKANTFSNNSFDYTDGGEYLGIVEELGIGVVPHSMLAYYDDEGGWWDELLCELITGHKSGAPMFFRSDLHRRWIDWFENKEGEAEAPFRLTGQVGKLEQQLRTMGGGHPEAELEEDDGSGPFIPYP